MRPGFPSLVREGRLGSRPWVDVVLPPFYHGWNCAGGWAAAARERARLGRVFAPDPARSEELFRYLARPQSDLLLLPGFDAHLAFLHHRRRWRDRFRACPAFKVAFAQESPTSDGYQVVAERVATAVSCVDLTVVHSDADLPFYLRHSPACRWQPFGVDTSLFRRATPFALRSPIPWFQGKRDMGPRHPRAYLLRSALIDHLLAEGVLEFVPFRPREVNHHLAEDYDRRRIALNLPSVFRGHTCRVLEAMACGCAVVTPRLQGERDRELFRDGEHLFLYDPGDPPGLVRLLRRLMEEEGLAEGAAERGWREARERHTLLHRLEEVLGWADAAGAGGGRTDRRGEDLPVLFFTELAEGAPFPASQLRRLAQVPFPWRWRLLGSALPAGAPPGEGRISLLPAPPGAGEVERRNALLAEAPPEALLWELRPEEEWSAEALVAVRSLFLEQPGRTTVSLDSFLRGGQVPGREGFPAVAQERLRARRVWRARRGDRWKEGYSCPRLCRRSGWVARRWAELGALERPLSTDSATLPFLYLDPPREGVAQVRVALTVAGQLLRAPGGEEPFTPSA